MKANMFQCQITMAKALYRNNFKTGGIIYRMHRVLKKAFSNKKRLFFVFFLILSKCAFNAMIDIQELLLQAKL
jgi:hypothetical protein